MYIDLHVSILTFSIADLVLMTDNCSSYNVIRTIRIKGKLSYRIVQDHSKWKWHAFGLFTFCNALKTHVVIEPYYQSVEAGNA